MLALEGQHPSEVGMSDREIRVEFNGLPSEAMRAFKRSGDEKIFIQRPHPGSQVGIRESGIGPSVVRIEGDGALEERRAQKVGHVERRPPRAQDVRSAHEKVVRLPGRRRLQQRALGLGLVDMGHQDRNDRPGHLVLNGEDVLQLAVVTLGPTMSAGSSIDELGVMRMRSPAQRMLPSRR